MHYTLYMVFI